MSGPDAGAGPTARRLAELATELPPGDAGDGVFVVVTHADGKGYTLAATEVAPKQVAGAAAALLGALLERYVEDTGNARPLLLSATRIELLRLAMDGADLAALRGALQ